MSKSTLFGCRSPSSKGVGRWDGAFVCYHNNIMCVRALFVDGMDFVNNEYVLMESVLREYNEYIEKGWIQMTSEDLRITTGIKINENICTDIPMSI